MDRTEEAMGGGGDLGPVALGARRRPGSGGKRRGGRGGPIPLLTSVGARWSVEGGRRWRAEVAGYGCGGGTADLGKGRVVVEMVVVAESCAEAYL